MTNPRERADGADGAAFVRASLPPRDRAILASAYELQQAQVEQDAADVRGWGGTDAELLAMLQARHGWSAESEYAPFYVAALRQALRPAAP